MNLRHLEMRLKQVRALAECSVCPRGQHGCLLINPVSNSVLSEGYNGGPRGGKSSMCGMRSAVPCERQGIQSGTQIQIGCHHAEMNAICNAASNGISTQGAWAFITGEPCLMCAKLLHHAGVERVLYLRGGYTTAEGVAYLKNHGVEIDGIVDHG